MALALTTLLAPAGCDRSPDEVSPEALAARAERARPDWANYGEDIKAALGAAPAARWSGRPFAAQLAGSTLYLTFAIDPPWQTYSFGMPILVRDPLGRVHRPAHYAPGKYEFVLDGFAPGAIIPWVEVRYPPNEEQRIVFDGSGSWRATGPS